MADPGVKVKGMGFEDGNPNTTLIYFNHSCGTTFAIPVDHFRKHLEENVPEFNLAACDLCPGSCNSLEDMSECDQDCQHAPYRRLMLNMIKVKRANRRILSETVSE